MVLSNRLLIDGNPKVNILDCEPVTRGTIMPGNADVQLDLPTGNYHGDSIYNTLEHANPGSGGDSGSDVPNFIEVIQGDNELDPSVPLSNSPPFTGLSIEPMLADSDSEGVHEVEDHDGFDDNHSDSEDFVSRFWWPDPDLRQDEDDAPEPTTVEEDERGVESVPDGGGDDEDIPASVIKMRNDMMSSIPLDYPGPKPAVPPPVRPLSRFEVLSLQHYAAWIRTNGTVEAYYEHGALLEQVAETPILSLHRVKQLARRLVDFTPRMVDMCPKSCIAYTGAYQEYRSCPYKPSKGPSPCNLPRYYTTKSGRQKPCAQVQILPVAATIRALFANAETATLLRHRDRTLQKTLRLLSNASTMKSATYSEFADSQIHILHHEAGLFKEPQDMAFAISTDGAQLTMKKQSNTWLLILIILDLPGDLRYKGDFIIVNFATPGPNSPGDIESFLYPLLEEAAVGSEGTWIWSAIESDHLLMRWYIALALGDMLGSAKMNGMVGHTGYFGDRFSLTSGMKSGGKGKPQYYPILSTPFPPSCNPGNRPDYSNPDSIPMRTQAAYLEVIKILSNPSISNKDKAEKIRTTGISRLPYCAASPCFIHPTFFPLDPFHLFYENCMPYLWDLWTSDGQPGEIFRLAANTVRLFGEAIAAAMSTLPAAFCGPVRDTNLKRNSQYKAFEWMAILHWYIIPLAVEYGEQFDSSVLANFARFVQAVEFSMAIVPRSDDDIQQLRDLILTFLTDYQRLYIGTDPSKISRARLCLFQLIHVPLHIQWYGSIRIGSQATVERMIGELGHKIRSKKAPFAHLTNIIYQRELLKVLSLHYPELKVKPRQSARTANRSESSPTNDANFDSDLDVAPGIFTLRQHCRIAFTKIDSNSAIDRELAALSAFLDLPLKDVAVLKDLDGIERGGSDWAESSDFAAVRPGIPIIRRWGKLKLPNGRVLGSRLSKSRLAKSAVFRGHEWFEVMLCLYYPRF